MCHQELDAHPCESVVSLRRARPTRRARRSLSVTGAAEDPRARRPLGGQPALLRRGTRGAGRRPRRGGLRTLPTTPAEEEGGSVGVEAVAFGGEARTVGEIRLRRRTLLHGPPAYPALHLAGLGQVGLTCGDSCPRTLPLPYRGNRPPSGLCWSAPTGHSIMEVSRRASGLRTRRSPSPSDGVLPLRRCCPRSAPPCWAAVAGASLTSPPAAPPWNGIP